MPMICQDMSCPLGQSNPGKTIRVHSARTCMSPSHGGHVGMAIVANVNTLSARLLSGYHRLGGRRCPFWCYRTLCNARIKLCFIQKAEFSLQKRFFNLPELYFQTHTPLSLHMPTSIADISMLISAILSLGCYCMCFGLLISITWETKVQFANNYYVISLRIILKYKINM